MAQDKISIFYKVLNQWMSLKENNRDIDIIINEMGCKTVAIWEMGSMAEHIYQALKNSNILCRYVIDDKSDQYDIPLKVYNLRFAEENMDKIEKVDLMIYTNLDIKDDDMEIAKQLSVKIISIFDLVHENFDLGYRKLSY